METSANNSLLEYWPEVEWTDDELAVYRTIRARHGQENAIQALEIAEAARIGQDNTPTARARRVREIVSHLIEFHHMGIASSCGKPSGYYMPWGAGEINKCHRWLLGLGLKILKHAWAVKKNSRLEAILGQLEMEFQTGGPDEREEASSEGADSL